MTNKLIERLINKEYLTERERKEWLNAVKERLEALENENEKLKKALWVFSTHLQIERGCQEEWLQFKNGEDQSDDLTREEYKLLKDVLGNKI